MVLTKHINVNQLGKIDKSKTEFLTKIQVFIQTTFMVLHLSHLKTKTDNGTGLIDVFRTFKRDMGFR